MTASPEISQIQVRRTYAIRGLRPGVDIVDTADPGDEATEQFNADSGDRPTSALEVARSAPATPAPATTGLAVRSSTAARPAQPGIAPQPARTSAPTNQSQAESEESPLSAREIGPGSVLRGRYLIDKAIGVGGTSTVFSALDRHRARGRGENSAGSLGDGPGNGLGNEREGLNSFGRIAVKVLRSETGNNDARVFRMEREFRQMQRLTHSGIVRVFDLDCEDDLWFITMELLEGQPLHRYLRTGLKDAEAFRILTQCAEALAYAHEHGIVHGDLKPSNVFVSRDGSVRLFDFGSAPDLDEAAADPSVTQRFAATPPYASPETLEGKGVEPRDDLFSLGCLAYELLAGGQHPFDRKSSLDARQQNMRPPYVRTIRPRHFAVIAKALSWDRAARPASAREFLHAFLASEFARETAIDAPISSERSVAAAPMPAAWSTQPQKQAENVGAAPFKEEPTAAIRADSVGDAAANPLPIEDISLEWIAPSTEDIKPQPAEASPAAATDDQAAKRFAGFVPQDMVVRAERKPTPAASSAVADLHVAGLSESTSSRIRRMALLTLLIAALLAGLFLFSQYLRTETTAPVTPAPTLGTQSAVPAPSSDPATGPETAAEVVAPPAAPEIIPRAPGEVSFEAATVNVGSAQAMAVVNVMRSKSTRGVAPVTWSTVGDTARPGVHYESIDSRIARFNDGQSVRSLFIPLKFDAGETTSRPARSFIVKLERAAGGPTLGAITQARVIVEGIE
jgi:serine/threonine protein kinase